MKLKCKDASTLKMIGSKNASKKAELYSFCLTASMTWAALLQRGTTKAVY